MKYNIYCSDCNSGIANKDDDDFVVLREGIAYGYIKSADTIVCLCPNCRKLNYINKFCSFIMENDTSVLEECMQDKYCITEDGIIE